MIKMYQAGELNEHQQNCFITPRSAEELYDVVNDPFQLTNLAEVPESGKTLVEMRSLLDKWVEEYNDKVPGNPTPDKFDRWTGKRLNNNKNR
jgi:N-sulfoglucosamine sulfohydrolase